MLLTRWWSRLEFDDESVCCEQPGTLLFDQGVVEIPHPADTLNSGVYSCFGIFIFLSKW